VESSLTGRGGELRCTGDVRATLLAVPGELFSARLGRTAPRSIIGLFKGRELDLGGGSENVLIAAIKILEHEFNRQNVGETYAVN
jgi:hypothetical protein